MNNGISTSLGRKRWRSKEEGQRAKGWEGMIADNHEHFA